MREIVGHFSEKQQHWVGDGFPVRSLLTHENTGRFASPFLMLDYAGPYKFNPKSGQPRGVGAHPHKGFETVTIVYKGEVEHRDSTGAGGIIGPGDVQWMTAGRGIIHQEFHSDAFSHIGGDFEMIQLWVNLPAKDKSVDAGYQNITAGSIPTVKQEGIEARIIAGNFGTVQGPAETYSAMNVWDIKLVGEQSHTLPIPETHNTTLVVLRGEIDLNGQRIGAAESVVLAPGNAPVTFNAEDDSFLLVLSGEPIDEPVVQYGPFVMNTQAEIREAIKEYNAGRFGKISA